MDYIGRVQFRLALIKLRERQKGRKSKSRIFDIVERWRLVQGTDSPGISEVDRNWLNDRIPRRGFHISYGSGTGQISVTDSFEEDEELTDEDLFLDAERVACWHFAFYLMSYFDLRARTSHILVCEHCGNYFLTNIKKDKSVRHCVDNACRQSKKTKEKREEAKKAKKAKKRQTRKAT